MPIARARICAVVNSLKMDSEICATPSREREGQGISPTHGRVTFRVAPEICYCAIIKEDSNDSPPSMVSSRTRSSHRSYISKSDETPNDEKGTPRLPPQARTTH